MRQLKWKKEKGKSENQARGAHCVKIASFPAWFQIPGWEANFCLRQARPANVN
ncbi:MAG TPA: hypothetical protein VGY56_20725 [Verrucomicrobiae bacterium]|nr:hypothetical protein [Verrucomicrobiae bacterium]